MNGFDADRLICLAQSVWIVAAMNEYAPWYDAPIPPVNYRFGKFARAPSSVTATWADNHQLMFSKDNHRMTTNLRSYFDRPRELLDNSGLNERRPLQVHARPQSEYYSVLFQRHSIHARRLVKAEHFLFFSGHRR